MSLNLPTARRATFHKTRKGANKPLNWPHPLVPKSLSIHADKLSQAGFIHSPTLEQPDRTTCFLCAVEVSDWIVRDEVWGRHREMNGDCAFLKMEEVVWNEWKEEAQWDWGVDGVDWPRSERMDRARLETFAVGWPHEGALGIPTKEEIAAAGMYFKASAAEDEADNCVCPYCARAVSQWEAGDDPLALHRRKAGVNCPFFIAVDPRPPPVLPKKIKSTESLGKPKKKASPPVVVVAAVEEEIVEKIVQMDIQAVEEVPQIEEEVVPAPIPKKSRAKGKKTASISAEPTTAAYPLDPTTKIPLPSKSPSEPSPVPVETPVVAAIAVEVEEVEVTIVAPVSKAKSKKGKGNNSVVIPEPVEELAVEQEVVVAAVVEEEEELEVVPVPKLKPSSKKGKGKASKKNSVVVPTPIEELPVEQEDEPMVDVVEEQIIAVERPAPIEIDAPVMQVFVKITSPAPIDVGVEKSRSIEMEVDVELELEVEKPVEKEKKEKEKKKGKKKGGKSKKLITPRPDDIADLFSSIPPPPTLNPTPPPLKLTPFSTFIPSPHPFPPPSTTSLNALAEPTEAELNLTLEEWYTLSGNRAIEAFERECRREEEVFKGRLEEATRRIVGLRDEAVRREEGRKRA